jgi:hypothetical protein
VLPSGQVLVVGGQGATDYPAAAELYNTLSSTFSLTGSLTNPRQLHTATLDPNFGTVVIIGGIDANQQALDSIVTYDPDFGEFTDSSNLVNGRYGHAVARSTTGGLMIIGGTGGTDDETSALVELY